MEQHYGHVIMDFHVLLNEQYINLISRTQLNKLKNYLETNKTVNTKSLIITHFPPIKKYFKSEIFFTAITYIKLFFMEQSS